MTSYLLSIDPGKSSGLALFSYSETRPAKLVQYAQVEGGVEGLLDWMARHHDFAEPDMGLHTNIFGWGSMDWQEPNGSVLSVVVEKFTPRQALSLDAAEPLVCEGALIALGIIPKYTPPNHPNWQQPAAQYFAGGKTLAEKKKRQHAWLKENGFYVTGKDVGCKDADDVRSAIAHGLVWFRRNKHLPTLERFFRGDDEVH